MSVVKDPKKYDPQATASAPRRFEWHQPLSAESTQKISRVLGKRVGPLRLETRGRRSGNQTTTLDLRASLAGLDAELLVPLRPQGALSAFLCLGPKLSGDVYTSTDLSLLASVAHHVSGELSGIGGD